MRDVQLQYEFETDDEGKGFDLVLHVRGTPRWLIDNALKRLLGGAEARGALARLDGVEKFSIPAKYHKRIFDGLGLNFARVRARLERKHGIVFCLWEVRSAFMFRNIKDKGEWVLTVIYRGHYKVS